MITDPIFYRLFQTFPSIFFELINHSPEEAKAYSFSSVEVKELSFRIDGVFLPNTPNAPIYFVEVQFQPDTTFYSRLFAEIFIYLKNTELPNDWRAVIIFPNRNVDKGQTQRYRALLTSEQVTRIYLDELDFTKKQPLGIQTVQLIILSEETAAEEAKAIMSQVQAEVTDEATKQSLLELIESIIIYKFPNKTRQEIEQMLGIGSLKQTRVYQEGKEEGKAEGKLQAVPAMLQLGATIEYIAEALNLEIEQVRQIAQQQSQ